MTDSGWIKIHRQLLEWEWYDDIPTKVLFFHMLLRANHKPKKWRGIEIGEGEFISGRIKLAEETGLSEQQIRTSISKLKSTSELTIKTTNRYSLFKLTNWNRHQSINQPIDQQATNKQPTSNQQITTNKNENNEENDNKYNTVFNFWNSKKITHHKKITNDIKLAIDKRLKEYSDDEILTAITNYDNILKSEATYFAHKWTLTEFLTRSKALPVFLHKSPSDYLKTSNRDIPKNNLIPTGEMPKIKQVYINN